MDETPREQLFALINSGVYPLSAFTYSIIPQAFPNLLSYSFYRFECSIRSATVLGIIGAGRLGYQIHLSLQSLRYEQVWTLVFALLFLSGVTDILGGWLRQGLELSSPLDLNVLNLKKRSYIIKEQQSSHQVIGFLAWIKFASLSFIREPVSSRQSRSEFNQCYIKVWLQRIFDRNIRNLLIGGITLLIFCFWYIKADFSKLWSFRTIKLLTGVMKDTFLPYWINGQQLLNLCLQTLAMSILGITIAALGGGFYFLS